MKLMQAQKEIEELKKEADRNVMRIHDLERKLDVAVSALSFYANKRSWELSVIDDLCPVRTKLTKDKEEFGEVQEAGLASKLVLYGGKLARAALAEIEWSGE